jgi:hypothetical protein
MIILDYALVVLDNSFELQNGIIGLLDFRMVDPILLFGEFLLLNFVGNLIEEAALLLRNLAIFLILESFVGG